MKKFFTLFVLAILACVNAAAQFVPEDGKQYVIKDTRSDYYIVLAVGNDSQASDTDNTTQASLGVTGTPFIFTPSGSGFELSTDEGKYLGIGARPWNVGTTSPAVWTVNDYDENGLCHIYQNGQSKGLGVDNHTIGSGIYTDKSGQYWQIVEYVAPEETHHVTATLDGETVTMLEDGEGGYLVTYPEVETGDHTVVVSYDGEETSYDFTTADYMVGDATVSVGKVTVSYKDGEISVSGDGISAPVGPVDPVDPVEPTTTFKGVVVPNLTSVSSLAELEGIQLTFVDADQVSVLEEAGDGIYVQNHDGSEFYAIWHPLFGGTYEVNGNVVTLRNFFSDNTDGYFNELPAGKGTLYFEDYGIFSVSNADAEWDGYCQTFSVAFEGAPIPVPFELIVKNNNIVCANGATVEAAEAGVASDFYLGNEGLTAVGKTATLYKDGSAMTFSYTMVSNNGISFFGGASQITEPGTYILEVPEGTYVDAAGNPSVAFYGTWVVIQKDEPEPTVWNGNVKYAEAASLDALLDFTVEFEEASSVAASGFDVLGVVYDGAAPYAIVLANGIFDVLGSMKVEGGKATFGFQKIADLDAAGKAMAKASVQKIGAFQPQAGKATVVFAGKSFVVDGQLVNDVLSCEYEFEGGAVTGIESIAAQDNARIFDLQGRRVSNAQKGLYIVSGKKVVR